LRTRGLLLIFLLVSLVAGAGPASARTSKPIEPQASTWTRTGGPTNVETSTMALAIDPIDPSTIFRAGVDGVFKSTNGGGTWTKTGPLPGVGVRSLAIDPGDPQTLYAGMWGDNVWKTVNGGVSWFRSGSGLLNPYVFALAVNPRNTQTVYAANARYVQKTTDGGLHWKVAGTGLPSDEMLALAIDPIHPNTVYVGTNSYSGGDGVYKSSDGGATWVSASQGELGTLMVSSLAIDPTDPHTVYAGTYDLGGGEGGVFKTSNGGASWVRLTTLVTVAALAIDPLRSTRVYAATTGSGVFKTTDGGATWRAVNQGLGDPLMNALAIDPSKTGTIYAGAQDGVFKTLRGGATWKAVTAIEFGGLILALVADPSAPGTVYAGTASEGVRKTTDGGRTWGWASSGLGSASVPSLAMDPSDPLTIYAAANAGAFKTGDGGSTWESINNGLTTSIMSIAVDPSEPSTVYAGGESSGVIFKSTDGGLSWVGSTGLPAYLDVTALAVDPTDSAVVYAGLSEEDADTQAGVYKSTDGGATWVRASNGFGGQDPWDTSVYGLAIDPVTPSTIYAAGGCGGDSEEAECYLSTVYTTSDAAAHWTDVFTVDDNAMTSIVIDPSDAQTVYAGRASGYLEGVYRTSDGGQTWAAFADGLPEEGVLSLAFDGSRALYAGTYDGVYKSAP
jgi:photosystem II stability/assembly factor-like uncharacterized protein